MNILLRIKRKLTKIRLTQIRVYCLHHVCEKFDSESMDPIDWMDINVFKTKIDKMRQQGITFISLPEAYRKITHDIIRRRKYAVLTFDDGYASLKEILPWLAQQNIPATLFISGKYLDGHSYRTYPKEQYLTASDLKTVNQGRFLFAKNLAKQEPIDSSKTGKLFTIGHHGWIHNDATTLTPEDFEESIRNNLATLSSHPAYIPFWAYTWGHHNTTTDSILHNHNIIPVLIDGMPNYNNPTCIHRCLLD